MNDINSAIIYRENELIVRKAFEWKDETYDIVVTYAGIQRMEGCAPADLAERIRVIWEAARSQWSSRDVTAEFTWVNGRMLVDGERVCVKQGANPMIRLHELIVGRFYQGISLRNPTLAATSMQAQAVSPKAASVPASSQLISPPIKPREPVSKPVISVSPRKKPKPCTEKRPVMQRPPVRLTEEVAETAFQNTMKELNQSEDEDEFFESLVEPLRALKRSEGLRNNEALRFIKLFADKIAEISPAQKNLSKFLAVNYFCTHAAGYVNAAGQTETELLFLLNQ